MSVTPITNIQRFIGKIEKDKGPILLIVGGIHGNEPAGIEAIEAEIENLKKIESDVRGSIYAIRGNLRALEQKVRYVDADLNRMWTGEAMAPIVLETSEYKEYLEIKAIINDIKEQQGARPLIVLDLHTTSSESLPFILCSDIPKNRRLVKPVPAPTVLGMENRIKGTLMNYINDMGDAAIVFEAGKHTAPNAPNFHKSIIEIILVDCGILNQSDVEDFEETVSHLYHHAKSMQYVFEATFRYGIKPDEKFKMREGFKNFMPIKQGTILADNQHGAIEAPLPGRIFMPLYQSKGSDGFFIINEVD